MSDTTTVDENVITNKMRQPFSLIIVGSKKTQARHKLIEAAPIMLHADEMSNTWGGFAI
jgi:hypothetical protein